MDIRATCKSPLLLLTDTRILTGLKKIDAVVKNRRPIANLRASPADPYPIWYIECDRMRPIYIVSPVRINTINSDGQFFSSSAYNAAWGMGL